MNHLDDLDIGGEPLDEAGSLMLQVVAAVDFMRRGIYPTLTIWSAIEQALRWHSNFVSDWTDPDPLLRAFRLSFSALGEQTSAETLSAAIRGWLTATSTIYNGSFTWEISLRRSPV